MAMRGFLNSTKASRPSLLASDVVAFSPQPESSAKSAHKPTAAMTRTGRDIQLQTTQFQMQQAYCPHRDNEPHRTKNANGRESGHRVKPCLGKTGIRDAVR